MTLRVTVWTKEGTIVATDPRAPLNLLEAVIETRNVVETSAARVHPVAED